MTEKAVTWRDLPPTLRSLLVLILEDAQHGRSPGQPAATRVSLRPWLGSSDASRQRCRRALMKLERLGMIVRLRDAKSGLTVALRMLPAAIDAAQRKGPGEIIEQDRHDSQPAPGSCPNCGCPGSRAVGMGRRVGKSIQRRRECWHCGRRFTIRKVISGGATEGAGG